MAVAYQGAYLRHTLRRCAKAQLALLFVRRLEKKDLDTTVLSTSSEEDNLLASPKLKLPS